MFAMFPFHTYVPSKINVELAVVYARIYNVRDSLRFYVTVRSKIKWLKAS